MFTLRCQPLLKLMINMDISLYMQMIGAVTSKGLRLHHFDWLSRTCTRVYIKENFLSITGKQWLFVERGEVLAERVAVLLRDNDEDALKEWCELWGINLDTLKM